MLKKLLPFLFILCLVNSAFSQKAFIRQYKDTAGYYGNSYSSIGIAETNGGYLMATGNGNLVKTDHDGKTTWTKRLLLYNTTNTYVTFNQLKTDGAGHFYLAGSFAAGGTDTIFVLSIDTNANILWQKYFNGGSLYNLQVVNNIHILHNGGVMLTSTMVDEIILKSYAFVAKLDGSGNIAWQKAFYDTTSITWKGNCVIYDMDETATGNIVYTGICNESQSPVRSIIFETDANGNFIWVKKFAQTNALVGIPYRVKVLGTGDIKLIIRHPYQGIIKEIAYLTLDNNGVVKDAKEYNEPYAYQDVADAYIDNNGTSTLVIGNAMVQINNSGVVNFAHTYLTGFETTGLNNIIATADGGFAAAGGISTSILFYADLLCIKTYANGSAGSFTTNDVITDTAYSNPTTDAALADTAFQIQVSYNFSFNSVETLRDTLFTFSVGSGVETLPAPESIAAYPNPVNYSLTVYAPTGALKIETIEMFDISGRQVYYNKPLANSYQLNTANLSIGTYLLRATCNNGTYYQKIVVQH